MRSTSRDRGELGEVGEFLPPGQLAQASRWGAALVHAYPTPQWAGLLRADLAWAEQQLARGYYDNTPGKPEEVRGYLAEARAHLARLQRRTAA